MATSIMTTSMQHPTKEQLFNNNYINEKTNRDIINKTPCSTLSCVLVTVMSVVDERAAEVVGSDAIAKCFWINMSSLNKTTPGVHQGLFFRP